MQYTMSTGVGALGACLQYPWASKTGSMNGGRAVITLLAG
jgi:hypothetical protein